MTEPDKELFEALQDYDATPHQAQAGEQCDRLLGVAMRAAAVTGQTLMVSPIEFALRRQVAAHIAAAKALAGKIDSEARPTLAAAWLKPELAALRELLLVKP